MHELNEDIHDKEIRLIGSDGEQMGICLLYTSDVFDDEMSPVEKKHSQVDWDISAAEKGGHAHFMFKEILEQPEAIRKTVSPRVHPEFVGKPFCGSPPAVPRSP